MQETKKKRLSFYDSQEHHSKNADKLIVAYTFFLTLAFFVAVPVAVAVTKEKNLLEALDRILTSPSKLVTDYFALGSLASAFLNTAICGLISNLVIVFSRVKANATTFAAYMLVIAHGFYGLNFLNMWAPMVGVLVFCLVTKRRFSENVHIALFSTALGPFVSELVFRYITNGSSEPSVLGIVLALVLGIASGFVVPALIPGTTEMHRGFNMYKAGLAIGIMGIFLFAFMYETFGIEAPSAIEINNSEYYSMKYAYRDFMNVFFCVLFGSSMLIGFLLNNRSFRGYGALLKSTGYGTDFVDKFGMPVCIVNFGVYGFFLLAYLNVAFILPEIFPFLPQGVGFTGPSVGVVFAALTFSSDGQQPRTVAPIALGYALLLTVISAICLIGKMPVPWTLSTQSYINGFAFATGLCPFAGKYGWRIGVLVGFLSAIICTSTAAMHGGFVLYNGGFNAGLTALVILPILDFYKVKPKFEDDTATS